MLTPIDSDTLHERTDKIIAYNLIFDGDKFQYKFDDFHFRWFERMAKITMGEYKVWEFDEAMKEIGKTQLNFLGLAKYCVQFGCKKYIRYLHKNDKMCVSFISAIRNHFKKQDVIEIFGNINIEKVKVNNKKRDTQSIVQFKTTTISSMTSLQTGTGMADLDEAERVDLQLIDDPTDLLSSLNNSQVGKSVDVVNEIIRGCNQATADILINSNVMKYGDFAQIIAQDERFKHNELFIFKKGWEKDQLGNYKGEFLWKDKYVMTENEVDIMFKKDKVKRVSIELLKRDVDYETSFLGMRFTPEDLMIRTDEQPMTAGKIAHSKIMGVDTQTFHFPEPNWEYILATDSSLGEGGDEQALVVMRFKINTDGNVEKEVVRTLASNQLGTNLFAEIVQANHEAYNKGKIGCENDGAEGKALIGKLVEKGVSTIHLLSMEDTDKRKTKTNTKIGFIPSASSKAEAYISLRNEISNIKVNCPKLLGEINRFTWDAYEKNTKDSRAGGSGSHFDLLRAFAIANYFINLKTKKAKQYRTLLNTQ